MRKIMIGLAVFIMVVLFLGPFVVGVWFEKDYRYLISSYHSDENIHIAILDYQRHWFSSDLILEIEVNQKYLQKWIETEKLPNQNPKILIQQHVQHGPIILHYKQNISNILGLAALQNKIIVSPTVNTFFSLLGVSHVKLESVTFASFLGNYFNHLLISGLNISNSDIEAGIKDITADFWIFPKQNRFTGELELTHFFVKNTDDLLSIPHVKIKLDQYLDKHDVLLGSGSINLSEILFKETDEKDIRITDLSVDGFTQADDDFLNANRKIKIKNIEIEGQLIGPVEMEVSFNQFYLPAIHDLFVSYRDVIHNGEVYQGQLRQQIAMILPKIIKPGSSINLNNLDVASADGNIKANGTFSWPEQNFLPSSSLSELIMSGQAQLELTVSKKWMAKIIHFASNAPDFIRDVAVPQKNILLNARNEMEFAIQRNAVFIDYLGDGGYISKQAEDILVDLQKNLVSMADYRKIVRDLFLDRQISLVVAYQLCWQYSQIIKPYDFLKARVNEFQKIAEQQMQEEFSRVLKQGYIIENLDEYSAKINWSSNAFTSNGLPVK